MKTITFIIALSCFVKTGLSQHIVNKRLFFIKESAEIDSIVDDFKRSFISPYKNNSYLTLNVDRGQNKRYNLTISYIDNLGSTTLIGNDDILNRPNLRYFRFKNDIVFFTGSLDLTNLFEPTLKKKSFKFKYPKVSPGISIKDLYCRTYKYLDGKFLPTYIKAY